VKVRVLVVDDSSVVRKLITDALSGDPDIEVCATASNGKLALRQIEACKPDIVTLDIEMPEMDGLEALKHLRVAHPRLPVIMFSTLTERGAMATIEALSRGANDYVTKPSNTGNMEASMAKVRDDLIPRIKVLTSVRKAKPPAVLSATTFTPQRARPGAAVSTAGKAVDVVAIAVSTGGPNALTELLPRLPADFPVPIVICQHMPPMFTRLLAERLSANARVKVFEGTEGAVLRPGTIWIAPGDFHMTVVRKGTETQLHMQQEAPENSCRPAADVLFRSVAAAYGARTLGVVLTGMGQDGMKGCEMLHQLGAPIIAQDEASSVVWGMPGAVSKAGLADKVLPLAEIAEFICAQARIGRSFRGVAA
jgi:two-component system chemotaxis response regulator CheB